MATDDRRSGRAIVILTATIDGGGERISVRVSNVSARGALAIGDGLPPAETQVIFHCNGVAIPSWVTWCRDGRAGLKFIDPVRPKALIQKATHSAAIVKDTRKVDFRRPGFRGNQMSDEERKVVEDWIRAQQIQSEEEGPPSQSKAKR